MARRAAKKPARTQREQTEQLAGRVTSYRQEKTRRGHRAFWRVDTNSAANDARVLWLAREDFEDAEPQIGLAVQLRRVAGEANWTAAEDRRTK